MVNYMNFQDWMFDKRVRRRNIRKGVIKRADYQEYLEALEDVSNNIAPPDEDEEEAEQKAEGQSEESSESNQDSQAADIPAEEPS